MLEWLSTILIGFLSAFCRDLFKDYLRDRQMKQQGAWELADRITATIQEKADVQHQVDNIDRGTAADVARRLRERVRTDS